MAGTMVEEPFKTVALPPPGLGDRPPCSRTGFGQTDQGAAHCVGRTNASSACSSSGIDYPRPLSIFPTRRTRTSGTVSDSIAHEHSPTTYVCRPRAFRPHRQQTCHRRFPYPVRPSASLLSSAGTKDMDSPTDALAPKIRVGLIHHPRKTSLISTRSRCVTNALSLTRYYPPYGNGVPPF